ncbi:gephyrin-like molybdotransferase Glp [Olivibacter sp. XZL3]|uniref:molybdopterin molybdotransferase MoeA n=1 Tax=Olivibacter sp. XZL3 TaxID=1735116 RepID=UPI0010658FC6|nr:gephyrin-like molybdotransferase Glp [Olivibacter sp. XZL3]
MDRLISVEEAKGIINRQVFVKRRLKTAVEDADGKVLATDLYAPMDIPAFDQSSMDGYAFAFSDWGKDRSLPISGEIPAGKQGSLSLQKGTTARIFTGAALPLGADTVVMQELVTVKDNRAEVNDPNVALGNYVRKKGSEIKSGELALAAGTVLNPATIGFLSGIGLNEIAVYAAPTVALVITGDELQQPGTPLLHGQVYEASSRMLMAALRQMGIEGVEVFFAKDELNDTIHAMEKALDAADVVLLTGGVSVGDYDFVLRAAEACGVDKFFHKIKQRPGKPLFFGRKGEQVVFGLPGNPSSVLTCFYEYVWSVLCRLAGKNIQLKKIEVPLLTSYIKNNQLTHFLKGFYRQGKVEILSAQESYRLRSFAMANCLVVLSEEVKTYSENELVEIHLLPTYG